jgi:plastocyanin
MVAQSMRISGMWLMRGILPLICWSVPLRAAEVRARIVLTGNEGRGSKSRTIPPSVIWLKSLQSDPGAAPTAGRFSLLQKNKMFFPHLLVVPVGSSVSFPNADPFFHNVFSLFDGKRFDLGLYEAGSMRSVIFSREGISYIFCNIHPDMSAVVLSLTTPFYGIADPAGNFQITSVPNGEYELHVWVEGRQQNSLNDLTRRIRITGESTDLGEIHSEPLREQHHLNKFGRPYEPDKKTVY